MILGRAGGGGVASETKEGKKPIKAAQRVLHHLHKLSNLGILNDLCKLITLFN